MKALLAIALFFSTNSALALGLVDRSAVQAKLETLRAQGFMSDDAKCEYEEIGEARSMSETFRYVRVCENKAGAKVRITETLEVTANLGSRCEDQRVLSMQIENL